MRKSMCPRQGSPQADTEIKIWVQVVHLEVLRGEFGTKIRTWTKLIYSAFLRLLLCTTGLCLTEGALRDCKTCLIVTPPFTIGRSLLSWHLQPVLPGGQEKALMFQYRPWVQRRWTWGIDGICCTTYGTPMAEPGHWETRLTFPCRIKSGDYEGYLQHLSVWGRPASTPTPCGRKMQSDSRLVGQNLTLGLGVGFISLYPSFGSSVISR